MSVSVTNGIFKRGVRFHVVVLQHCGKSVCTCEFVVLYLCVKGDSLEFRVVRFTSFGKDVIRKLNLHPDTFCQLALQYGYYRLHKK